VRKLASRKILKVHELVTELKSSVNTLHEKFQHHYQPKDVETSGKRELLTPDPLTVALVNSTKLNQIALVLRDRNLRVKNACSAAIQKMISLVMQSSRNSTGTADNVDINTDSDDVLSKLNIDGLKTCEGRSSLKSLKALLVHPNGNIVTRNPTNEKTVQIIRNLVVGGWTAVANATV
jgi:hypothetical protein